MSRNQTGIAILETAIGIGLLMSVLLAGWGCIDIFQRGMAIDDALKARSNQNVLPAYLRAGEEFEVDTYRINQALETTIEQFGLDLQGMKITEQEYRLQGAVFHLKWRNGERPELRQMLTTRVAGKFTPSVRGNRGIDLNRAAQSLVQRLRDSKSGREGHVRKIPWLSEVAFRRDTVSDSIVFIGISVALGISSGPARVLLYGAGYEPEITRFSLNVMRRDR